MDERPGHPSGDPGHADAPRPWEPPQLPVEHQQLGLTRNTEEGALVEFAASLSSAKRSHVLIAWVLLAAFVLPVLLAAVDALF